MNTDKIFAEQIANEYAPKETSKVKALKRLDNKAKLPALIFGYTFGLIAALVFGVGLCLSMHVIGPATTLWFVIGIAIGLVGIAGMTANYFIYKKLLNNGKKKYGQDIINLAKEIIDEDK